MTKSGKYTVAKKIIISLSLFFVLFYLLPFGFQLGPQKIRDYTYRELTYRVIANTVTKKTENDLAIAKSIHTFINRHVHVVSNSPVIDESPFFDLVRGIGWCDQQSWGMRELLAKKGIPAKLLMLNGYDSISHHSVAEVYLNGQWVVFDPLNNLIFYNLNGEIASFKDIQQGEINYDAFKNKDNNFANNYLKLYEAKYPPHRYKPLALRDGTRKAVSGIIDFYYALFGKHFANSFQDLYLIRTEHKYFIHPFQGSQGSVRLANAKHLAPDLELHLKARNYDLFFRHSLALKTYKKLIKQYPDSEYVDDNLYFMGVVYMDIHDWESAVETFTELIGKTSKWEGVARQFIQFAYKNLGKRDLSIKDYRVSAT